MKSISFTKTQQAELDRRLTLYKSGQTSLHSWEEVKKEWENRRACRNSLK